ncbi:hypothetical protein MTR_8g099110 [Medicago truncatula]|uniref:Transmembrane protein n=1 Tax=Medicago truncatula TaxID=3880 RepID=A0A072TWA9_MEDTR|nr:hypothetical protein MTR_8g099110 [Medicago truncatula]
MGKSNYSHRFNIFLFGWLRSMTWLTTATYPEKGSFPKVGKNSSFPDRIHYNENNLSVEEQEQSQYNGSNLDTIK